MMLSDQAHAFVDQLAKLLELAGVGIISTIHSATYPAERRVTGGDRSDSDVPELLA